MSLRRRGAGPVVHRDRTEKARTIEAVLTFHRRAPVAGLDLLDIGCGNGDIARHFVPRNRVVGVDIVDQRRPGPDFTFLRVASAGLPLPTASFDVVISNHVLEHIADQRMHLSEMRRVLRRNGIVYLATPNQSSPLMEGHVGVPGVLRWREMAPLFRSCALRPIEYSVDVAADPDRFHGNVRFARRIPRPMLRLLRVWFPSHIFILEPADPP